MRLKHLKIFENFIKTFPIQIPPNKSESIDIIISNLELPVYIKDVETSDINVIRNYFDESSECGVRHEALHILQELNIPDIFKNIKQLSIKAEWFDEIKENNWSLSGIPHEKDFTIYFSNSSEIMAYSFCFVLLQKNKDAGFDINGNYDSEFELNVNKIYESIGGDILQQFNEYCSNYSKVIN
jgi:hypothetical protein